MGNDPPGGDTIPFFSSAICSTCMLEYVPEGVSVMKLKTAGDEYEIYRIIFDITFFFFVIVILSWP